MPFRVVTINILSDLSLWEERRGLLVRDLVQSDPQLIALQEVNLQQNTAIWLAGELGMEYIHLTRKTGKEAEKEGIAILSRIPFQKTAALDLLTQNRVAQSVQVELNGQKLVLANGHFYWQPGPSPARLEQVKRLVQWLLSTAGDLPLVVCGDFNSTPESEPVRFMKARFTSAYEARHGREPRYTAPTPLPRSKRKMLRTLWNFRRDIQLRGLRSYFRTTLDYIFVNEKLNVLDSRLLFDQPAPGSRKIFASDHFGIEAELAFNT
ncbi:MAG: endonuclease/exonuclease/phosphatase family protein [Chloroflexi bacterium]|jgi:endonuclease/exonuclease/phosphatase family metal-dependent hydrolase|nr:endonuclease/exonuclease/phosphatase family protein [Chloroflexota bacterium]